VCVRAPAAARPVLRAAAGVPTPPRPLTPLLLRADSASKAFVDFFSRSLALECAPKGVLVQCHTPYFVVSEMSKIKTPSLLTPSADDYAAASLAALGSGGATIVPYWPHTLQDALLLSLPEWLQARIVMGIHTGLRARYIKKLERAATAAAK